MLYHPYVFLREDTLLKLTHRANDRTCGPFLDSASETISHNTSINEVLAHQIRLKCADADILGALRLLKTPDTVILPIADVVTELQANPLQSHKKSI